MSVSFRFRGVAYVEESGGGGDFISDAAIGPQLGQPRATECAAFHCVENGTGLALEPASFEADDQLDFIPFDLINTLFTELDFTRFLV